MNPTRRLIRPPAVGEVWYVHLDAYECLKCVDTAEVLELTEHTCLLKVYANLEEPEFTCRFETCSVKFIEFVRELPRPVETASCPTPLKATDRHLEQKLRDSTRAADPSPVPPPMRR